VILYKASNDELGASKNMVKDQARKWTYVGYVRAHTHDVRALTMAVPICSEGMWCLYLLVFSWRPYTGAYVYLTVIIGAYTYLTVI